MVSLLLGASSSSGDFLQFNETSESAGFITADAIVVIPSVIQLLFCVVVLRVFYKLPNLRTSANFPIINLIASDFVRALVGFLAVPLYSASKPDTVDKLSRADKILCQAFWFGNHFQFAWSSWAIVMLSYSRSDVIVNMLYPTFSKKRFWTWSAAIWVGSLVTTLPPFVGWSSYGYLKPTDSNDVVCSSGADGNGLLHALYLPLFYFINFVLPCFFVILCFSRIVRVVQHPTSSSRQSNIIMLANFSSPTDQSSQHPSTASQIKAVVKSKAFIYIVMIIISNVLLSFPYVFVQTYSAVISELGLHHLHRPAIAFYISSLLFTANFNVNSVLYIFWIKTFQHTTAAMFPCRRS